MSFRFVCIRAQYKSITNNICLQSVDSLTYYENRDNFIPVQITLSTIFVFTSTYTDITHFVVFKDDDALLVFLKTQSQKI